MQDNLVDSTETLSEKMKRFENETNMKLQVKTPVIIRLDGKAFHTFTKGFTKPFDEDLSLMMQYTAMKLAEELQNVKFIYSQSDEISVLLTDWDNPNTDTWYGYRIQKMTSVSASIATLAFNEKLGQLTSEYWSKMMQKYISREEEEYYKDRYYLLKSKKYKALFDSRTFNLQPEEVSNYFLYRYKDAKRNSAQALAQSEFSHKQLDGVSCTEMIQLVKEKSGIDYEELSSLQRSGFAIYKDEEGNWKLDTNVPDIYENRDYIEKWLR